ncbi:hypothetical protein NSERUTF1_4256 [Nocardia seriolae]|nr:hypothetical protein NSERUTF1_4256 [Nocardia seriolae]
MLCACGVHVRALGSPGPGRCGLADSPAPGSALADAVDAMRGLK